MQDCTAVLLSPHLINQRPSVCLSCTACSGGVAPAAHLRDVMRIDGEAFRGSLVGSLNQRGKVARATLRGLLAVRTHRGGQVHQGRQRAGVGPAAPRSAPRCGPGL